jgi:hypothetical protein
MCTGIGRGGDKDGNGDADRRTGMRTGVRMRMTDPSLARETEGVGIGRGAGWRRRFWRRPGLLSSPSQVRPETLHPKSETLNPKT